VQLISPHAVSNLSKHR